MLAFFAVIHVDKVTDGHHGVDLYEEQIEAVAIYVAELRELVEAERDDRGGDATRRRQ
jgi:hypothetical protein